MRKILTIAALLFLVSAAAPFKAAFGGNGSQPVPKITVISDEPQPSQVFIDFFYFFNQAMIRWWQEEGRLAAKGEWKILVSEQRDDDTGNGVTIVAARSTPGQWVILGFLPVTAKNARTAAATAADAAILVIKAAAKKEEK